MTEGQFDRGPSEESSGGPQHWTVRHSKPVIFLILTGVAVGIYLAFSIPVAVFPSTDFPRVTIQYNIMSKVHVFLFLLLHKLCT